MSSMLSVLDKGSKLIFNSFIKRSCLSFQRSSSFGYKDYPLWDLYGWHSWELPLKISYKNVLENAKIKMINHKYSFNV